MVRPVLSRCGRNTRAHASASTSSRRRSTASVRNFKFKLRENIGALKCKNDLKTSFLNIDGLSDAKLEDVSSYVRANHPTCSSYSRRNAGLKRSVPTSLSLGMT